MSTLESATETLRKFISILPSLFDRQVQLRISHITGTTVLTYLHCVEMKKCLYAIFSQFGRILDVVVMRNHRLRGQAWIAFEDQASATFCIAGNARLPFL